MAPSGFTRLTLFSDGDDGNCHVLAEAGSLDQFVDLVVRTLPDADELLGDLLARSFDWRDRDGSWETIVPIRFEQVIHALRVERIHEGLAEMLERRRPKPKPRKPLSAAKQRRRAERLRQMRRHPWRGWATPDNRCAVPGCGGQVWLCSVCRHHHSRWRQYREVMGFATFVAEEHRRGLPNTPPECLVPGCDEASLRRGLCRAHSTRWYYEASKLAPEVWAMTVATPEALSKLSVPARRVVGTRGLPPGVRRSG